MQTRVIDGHDRCVSCTPNPIGQTDGPAIQGVSANMEKPLP